jgi:ATP synthase protein I
LQVSLTPSPDADAPEASTPEQDRTSDPIEPVSYEVVAALPTPGGNGGNGMDDYLRLQRRLILSTVMAIALALPLTAWRFGVPSAASLLLGGLAGLLYLQLLSRSVSRLGVDTRSVGKVQLLVPVVLVLVAARVPQLQLLPALLGFLLYKPALIAQAVLDG